MSKSSDKRDAQIARTRNLIVGGVVVVIIAVAAYGLLYSSGITQGDFVAGTHYTVLDEPQRRRPGAPITVVEFFSYGCIHCKNFDPVLEEWLTTASSKIDFARSPAAFSPPWVLLAQTYLTFEALDILDQNHTRLFRQIHDNRQIFQSAEEISDFVDGNGATRADFLRTFNGPEVRRRLRENDSAQRVVNVPSVPALVVAGKYVVTMDHGRKTALEIVDHLIARELLERSQPATTQAATSDG